MTHYRGSQISYKMGGKGHLIGADIIVAGVPEYLRIERPAGGNVRTEDAVPPCPGATGSSGKGTGTSVERNSW